MSDSEAQSAPAENAGVSTFEKGLNWQRFVKAYSEHHSVPYPVAVMEAGEAWKEYKELHNIATKGLSKKAPESTVMKRKQVPIAQSGERRKNKVSVKAPPKGFRMVVNYEKDEDGSDDDEVEVVTKKMSKAKVGKKAVKAPPAGTVMAKKAGLKKKKKVIYVDSESESEESESGEE